MDNFKTSTVFEKNLLAYNSKDRLIINKGGTRCLVGDTLVKTSKGYIKIKDIEIGDLVYSINGNHIELKPVVNKFIYKCVHTKNKTIKFVLNKTVIQSTYDHKFRINGKWVKAIDIAKRTMESNRQSLCNIIFGSISYFCFKLENSFQLFKSKNNETSLRSRLFKNSRKWENCKDTQTCCDSFYSKSKQLSSDKSQKWNKARQYVRKFRMVYTSAKYRPCRNKSFNIFKSWFKKWDGKDYRRNSNEHKKRIQASRIWKKSYLRKIWDNFGVFERYNSWSELEPRKINRIEFIDTDESVYDIEVKDFHSYFITNKNIVSHNSGKTYSILQLLFLIAFYSKKPLVISIVSYALPHLKLGAIRDFEKILLSYGIIPESVKNISESYFKINGSVIEFFGVENMGKVHGPERDILYVNECNYIKSYDIVRQLLVRTRGTAFMDYNPARLFWIDDEIIGKRECKIIHSTYLDNQHLTQSQVEEIESNKHNENWWRVYGLGEIGRLEDVILSNWEFGEFDNSLPFVYGLDFGSKHPDAMVKCAVDNSRKIIYWQEKIYQSGLSTGQLIELIKSKGITNDLIVADSAGKRTIQDMQISKLNVRATVKNHIVDDIKTLWGYKIIVTPDSFNLAKNLNNWVWLDKKGEIPIDVDDDAIDAGRYAFVYLVQPSYRRNLRPI